MFNSKFEALEFLDFVQDKRSIYMSSIIFRGKYGYAISKTVVGRVTVSDSLPTHKDISLPYFDGKPVPVSIDEIEGIFSKSYDGEFFIRAKSLITEIDSLGLSDAKKSKSIVEITMRKDSIEMLVYPRKRTKAMDFDYEVFVRYCINPRNPTLRRFKGMVKLNLLDIYKVIRGGYKEEEIVRVSICEKYPVKVSRKQGCAFLISQIP